MLNHNVAARIAGKTNLKIKDVEEMLKALPEVVAEALKEGDKVELINFLTFTPETKESRTMTLAVSKRKGEQIIVPERRIAKIKQRSPFKRMVNGEKSK